MYQNFASPNAIHQEQIQSLFLKQAQSWLELSQKQSPEHSALTDANLQLSKLVPAQLNNIEQAITLFANYDQGSRAMPIFADIAQTLQQDSVDSDRSLCDNEKFAYLLNIAAHCEESENDDEAMRMYAFLQMLRPDQSQPYINNFSLVWQQLGIEYAAACYAIMLEVLPHPVFLLYAADCFYHAGKHEEARQVIQHIVDSMASVYYRELIDEESKREIEKLRLALNPQQDLIGSLI